MNVLALETEHAVYRWKILGMTYACMFSIAVVFQSVPPLLSWIIAELQISHAQAGLLMSLFALPGVFIAVPAGALSDRFGVKRARWLVWLGCGLMRLFISFLTFASDFFVGKGYEKGFAGFMSSIVMMGALLISPLVGYVLHGFRKEELFVGLGGLVLAILFVFVPSASFDIPMFIMIAITVAFTPPSIFSLPSKVLVPENLGLGFGILSMCSNVGVLVGPYLAGLARDLTNEYVISFYLMAFFAVLEAFTIILFRLLRQGRSLKIEFSAKG